MLCDTKKGWLIFNECADDPSGEAPDRLVDGEDEALEEEELLKQAIALSLLEDCRDDNDCTDGEDQEELLIEAIALSLAD